MVKSSTITLRVDKELKEDADKVLKSLGLTISTAFDMYLQQIVLTNSIPFELKLPEDKVSKNEIYSLISEALEEYGFTQETTSLEEVKRKYDNGTNDV
ncbi:type II toxin-antitoxin system RelB/DinJ family antitoxin [Macrococcoides goetzii]|uniref:Type II toxin-antitoxin system RelB/DinJ family antitoxin n=1 Tax=Macrococcoides goetzii TaxID=1891097 RepID=A0A2G5NV43_9STAP|nr:type II toxin-antitoxin system RelB/DinJ family antitoxin [Macrococcus goetzii]RAI79649.1 type II toxin-antitoxin system RelB/DinJ family antitoxin [Macrococcus goetzii]